MEQQHKALTREELQQTNAQHLAYLEAWGPQVVGAVVAEVDVLKAYTYDLIQVFNHVWLKAHLGVTS